MFHNKEITLTYFRLLGIVVVASLIVSISVSSVIGHNLKTAREDADQDLEAFDSKLIENQIDGCDRGNFARAAELIDSRGDKDVPPELVRQINPIVDCELTARLGIGTIRLDDAEATQYVALVAEGQKPIVENGAIIGTEQISFSRDEALEKAK